jgi:hypothetical protein
VKYDPEVSAPEFDGIVNFRELAPEALTLVSSVGLTVALPELAKIPKFEFAPPSAFGISAALSNPTHFTTPG